MSPAGNKKILLLEDSVLLASTLKREIERRAIYQVDGVHTFEDAKTRLQQTGHGYSLALLDLTLPDASQEEIIELFRAAEIPCIVMTNKFDEAQRAYVFSQGVIDFILKDGPVSLEYLFFLLDRLHRNQGVKIVLVDDSRSTREHMKRLLLKHNFHVLDAANGQDALDLLTNHPDARLVVVDYNMPGMDGYELTKRIRHTWSKDEMGILGISSQSAHALSARFLKVGANDFLGKPFLEEEFACRVIRNVENLEHIHALEEAATRDFLTGLYNRRFFREAGTQLFAALRDGKHKHLCAAMLDVDFFKKVNDTYGHDAGDAVLREMGTLLKRLFTKPDIAARLGGEEFCLLLAGRDQTEIASLLEGVRQRIEATVITYNGMTIPITASIGASTQKTKHLDELINQADAALYRAKHNGRNRVVFHDAPD
ncbi:MAG: diguanylate cyclase [Magnetococcales bacterium]|nr:diguanylate cyclase [Magnetococcales bacterium]